MVMSLGLSDKLRILQQSPHDLAPDEPSPGPATASGENEPVRWVPSRYNVRSTTEDGRLVIWNSYRGTMSVFGAAQRKKVESLLSQKGFAARHRGFIDYLYQRGFLVKEGTDEYRRIRLGFGQEHYRTDTLQLILLASEDCNFRCTYCYEDFARGTMKPWVRGGIKKLIEKRARQLRSLAVSWFGGEPLYGMAAIDELAPFFIEAAEKHSLTYSSQMTTNGYLLTPDVAERLLSWKVTKYQITLDGMPEDHDRSRPSRDGGGTFATIMENFKSMSLRPEDFAVDVRFNFDPRTSQRHQEFFDLFERELKADPRFRLRFRAVGQWGGPNDDKLEVCGIKDSFDLEREMKHEARRRGLPLADELSTLRGMGSQVCYAARPYNFIVGANGKLMKCTIDLDKNPRNVLGQLTEEGELLVDQDKLAMWTEPTFESDTKCQKCVVLPVCQGMHCPMDRFDTGETSCTPLRMEAKKDLAIEVQKPRSNRRAVLGQELPAATLLPSA
jgi:uncharacterized protein